MKKSFLIAAFAIVFILIAGYAFMQYTNSEALLPVPQYYELQDIDRIGRIAIWGQINGYTTPDLYQKFQQFKAAGITKVKIFIMSPGGAVVDAFGAVDVIKRAQRNGMYITTSARGLVASAAIPIFVSGDWRIAGPNTVFMLHKPDRSYVTDENHIEAMDLMEKLYIQIVADGCGLCYVDVDDLCTEYTWFTAKKAMQYDMVDEIN